MNAIQVRQTGSCEALECVEVEVPSPGPGHVLVRVVAASVNYADTMIRKGTYPGMPPLPTIPGLEGSGIVESVGDNVTKVWPGQRVIVFAPHCYAHYVVAEAASLFPIPAEIDLEEAATLPVAYGTAYHLLHTMAQIKAGHTITLRAPAGGVGTAVIQLAKQAGATVLGLTGSELKARFATLQGCDHSIINDPTDQVVRRVQEITNGVGVDLVLNSVAGDTFRQDFEMLAHFGQVIWYGFAAGPPQGNLMEQLSPHLGKSVGIRFFSLYSMLEAAPRAMEQSIVRLIDDLREKKIRPHIQERIPLSEAPRAHDLLERGGVMGKLILKP